MRALSDADLELAEPFMPAWAVVAYVYLIIDAFSRMIVGWRCVSYMRTEMVLDAIELAETVNGYYKAELVCGPARPGPWKTVEDLEFATLGWVHWHNTQRLHGYLGDVPPAECENAFYAVP